MQKILKSGFFVLATVLAGCEKNFDDGVETANNLQLQTDVGKLVLGKKLENPYSLANVEKSRSELKKEEKSLNLKGKSLEKPLEATHRYLVVSTWLNVGLDG
ncbi:MAG: hypothetical protein Q4G08_05310 [Capnocytophaga sp.]|nr:hypothetical protein [Capnocytophaga sp.]